MKGIPRIPIRRFAGWLPVILLASVPAFAAPPGPPIALRSQAAPEAPEEEIASRAPADEAEKGESVPTPAVQEPAKGPDVPTPAVQEAEALSEPSPIVAAAWCAVRTGEPEEGDVGCDIGVGAALWRRGQLFLAGVVGQETAGFGFGVTAFRSEDGRLVVAAAIGIVAPYGEHGIDAGRAALAVGATFGIRP